MTDPFYGTAEWKRLRKQALERDGGRCVVPGCGAPAVVVEHTRTRRPGARRCDADRLELLISLCRLHDNQVKEKRRGRQERRSGGRFTVPGCDATGQPYDAGHWWNR